MHNLNPLLLLHSPSFERQKSLCNNHEKTGFSGNRFPYSHVAQVILTNPSLSEPLYVRSLDFFFFFALFIFSTYLHLLSDFYSD